MPAWLVLNRWGRPDIYHQLGGRKRHCPREAESWELSSHSDALLTGHGLWPIKVSLYISRRWDRNRKRKSPQVSAHWEDRVTTKLCNKCWLAGHDQKQTAKCLSGLDQEKGPLCSKDTGRNPRSCNSWAASPSGSALSAGPCSQQSRSSVQCKQPVNGSRAFYSGLVWLKKKKKKHNTQTGVLLCFTKAVLFWLQVQDSWAIRRGKTVY